MVCYVDLPADAWIFNLVSMITSHLSTNGAAFMILNLLQAGLSILIPIISHLFSLIEKNPRKRIMRRLLLLLAYGDLLWSVTNTAYNGAQIIFGMCDRRDG
jgi:hypothetical protein